jgi:hypothetical protein
VREGVLEDALGKGYRGIISCDFYGAYRKFGRVSGGQLPFCWAHLIRDVLFLAGLKEVPVVRYGKRILKRIRGMFETIHLREREEDYFRFIGEGIEATNNLAEQTIRQSVLDRVVTQGSRGIAGNEWHERFWSVFTACGMQNISVMNCLRACLPAYIGMRPFPDLINQA